MKKYTVVDIHSHILPGVDDGARDIDESLELIMDAVNQGASTIIATPHAGVFIDDPENVREAYKELSHCVKEAKLDVVILLGAEIFCNKGNIEYIVDLLNCGEIPSINGTEYVLCEFDFWGGTVDEVLHCIRRMRENNWIPIIAHAERYADYLSERDMRTIVEAGALLQVNASDFYVSGHYPEWVDMARFLVENELASFIGSDMHSTTRRPPHISDAVGYLEGKCSEEYMENLLYKNAHKLLIDEQKEEEEMENKIKKDSKYLDGIMGVVVGDALGMPVQFWSREEVDRNPVTTMRGYGTMNLPEGSWTDDSSLTLAMLSSLKEKGCYNLEDIMARFAGWLENGDYTPYGYAYDIGYTCECGIENYIKSKDVYSCGLGDEYSNGNGSLMRTMPICLHVYDEAKSGKITESAGIEMIENVSALTHAHKRSRMACGFYYFIVKHILDEKYAASQKTIQECMQDGLDEAKEFYRAELANLTELAHFGRICDLEELKNLDRNSISSSGYVIHTFEAALWSLIRTNSLEDALLLAVNLADDADTVGAVAGGLAGLYYGYESIPEEWLSAIKKREWIEGLAELITWS